MCAAFPLMKISPSAAGKAHGVRMPYHPFWFGRCRWRSCLVPGKQCSAARCCWCILDCPAPKGWEQRLLATLPLVVYVNTDPSPRQQAHPYIVIDV